MVDQRIYKKGVKYMKDELKNLIYENNIRELIKKEIKLEIKHRRIKLEEVMAFIDSADDEELYKIIEEIRCVHDNLMVFDMRKKELIKVESTCLNGEGIQLNVGSKDDMV